MILTARGIEQQIDGTASVRNFLNILLVTGKIGRIGCGYGAITGQGNGQGAREHGQKADQLPGYRDITNPYIEKKWPKYGISMKKNCLEKVYLLLKCLKKCRKER